MALLLPFEVLFPKGQWQSVIFFPPSQRNSASNPRWWTWRRCCSSQLRRPGPRLTLQHRLSPTALLIITPLRDRIGRGGGVEDGWRGGGETTGRWLSWRRGKQMQSRMEGENPESGVSWIFYFYFSLRNHLICYSQTLFWWDQLKWRICLWDSFPNFIVARLV